MVLKSQSRQHAATGRQGVGHSMDANTRSMTLQTLNSLPACDRPYTQYDIAVVSDILKQAELDAKLPGDGNLSLPAVLKAYEQVLPKHGVKAAEDVYYYRLLLKLSLDPEPNWWMKLNRETGQQHQQAHHGMLAGGVPEIHAAMVHNRDISPTKSFQMQPPGTFKMRSNSQRKLSEGGGVIAHINIQPAPPRNNSARAAPVASSKASVGTRVQNGTAALNGMPRSASNNSNRVRNMVNGSVVAEPHADAAAADIWPGRPVYAAHDVPAGLQPAGSPAAAWPPGSVSFGTPASPIAYLATPIPNMVQVQQPLPAVGMVQQPLANQQLLGSMPNAIATPGTMPPVTFAAWQQPVEGLQQQTAPLNWAAQQGHVPAGRHGSWPTAPSTVSLDIPGQALHSNGPNTLTTQSLIGEEDLLFDEEEAAAYSDFQRLAGSFRQWSHMAGLLKDTKQARAAAVENWLIAMSFWETHLARRCLHKWATYKERVMQAALDFWLHAALRDAFQTWRQSAKYLRVINTMSSKHSVQRLRVKAWGAWRQHCKFARTKACQVMTALKHWSGHSLQNCFQSWRNSTHDAIVRGDNADSHYAHFTRRLLFKFWVKQARKLASLHVAAKAISDAYESRVKFAALSKWHARWASGRRQKSLLEICGARLRNRCLLAAFNSWLDFTADRKDAKACMMKAGHLFAHASLTRAWMTWKDRVVEVKVKRQAATQALRFWTHRSVAQAWSSWKMLVAWSHDNQVLARQHAQHLLAYLQRDCWKEWRAWHDRRMAKADIVMQYAEQLQTNCLRRCTAGWRAAMLRRRLDLQGCNAIMEVHVERLKATAWKRLQLAWRRAQKEKSVKAEIEIALATRSLRHWRVLARYNNQRRERRADALRAARKRRQARLLSAWQLAAAERVEHRQLIMKSETNRNRRSAKCVIIALRQAVLYSANMKMKELSATVHWQEYKTKSALSAWRTRNIHWRRKREKLNKARQHHNARMLETAFIGLLGQWQSYQEKIGKALMHFTMTENQFMTMVLRQWRAATQLLSAKHNKVRHALAHWIGGILARCFYHWRDQVQGVLYTRERLSAAVSHWFNASMAKAFMRWKEWALYKVELHSKASAYLSLLCGRTAAWAFLMLRANAGRKHRSRDARRMYCKNLQRRVIMAWRQRQSHRLQLESDLTVVFQKMLGLTVRQTFQAWHEFVVVRRHMSQLATKSLFFWMGNKLQRSFNTLKWYALRRQMKRTVVLKYNLMCAQRCLKAWREEAKHQHALRARWMGMLHRTQKQVLRDSWDSWHEYMHMRKTGSMANEKAIGYLRNLLLARAWNTWKEHHQLCAVAKKVVHNMMNRSLASSFRAWCEAVQDKKDAVERAEQIVLRMKNRDLAVGFQRLKMNVVWNAKKRTADSHFFRKQGKRVLQAWQYTTKLQMAINLWTGNCLQLAWDQWRSVCGEKKRLRITAGTVAKRWINMQLSAAWQQWRSICELKKRLRVNGQTIMKRWLNMQLSAAWQQWRAMCESKKRLRSTGQAIMKRWLNLQVSGAWQQWRVMCAAKKQLRATALKITKRWINLQLSGAWQQWRSLCVNKQHMRITASTVARRWLNMQLSAAWQQWRDYTLGNKELQAKISRALGFWINQNLAASWQAWREFVDWRCSMKAAASSVIAKIQHRALLGAWNAWVVFMYLAVAKRRAVLTWTHRSLRAAFNTWLEHTTSKTFARQTADTLFSQITAMLAGQTTSAVFAVWKEHAHRMSRLRLVLHKVLGRVLELSFGGWRVVAQEKAQRKRWLAATTATLADRPVLTATCMEVMRVWRAWPLSAAFAIWWANVQEHKQLLQRAAQAVYSYVGNLLRKAFDAWRNSTSHRVSWKNKIVSVLWGMDSLRLRRVFAFWAAFAPYMKHMKHAMAMIQLRLARHTLKQAWGAWGYCMAYNKTARKAVGALMHKVQRSAFQQWRDVTATRRQHKQIIRAILGKLQNRVLAGAFATWRDVACCQLNLKLSSAKVIARMRNMALSAAWDTWRALVEEKAEGREKFSRAVQLWGNVALTSAWNTWKAYWQAKTRKTLADVHYWGRLLDNAWITWHEFVDDQIAMRGMQANRMVIYRRAIDSWRAWAQEAARTKQLNKDMGALLTLRTLGTWRLMAMARLAVRKLYKRRALVGWYQRVLHLQQQRHKLRGAVQLLLFGSQARLFRAWRTHTAEQMLKRTVFAQKQAAIKEALRIGDEIRARRNDELVTSTFRAWRLQVGIFRTVATRFAAIMQRGLASAFREWHDYVVDIRAANNRALEHFRVLYQDRYLHAWHAIATELAIRSAELDEAGQDLRFRRIAARVLRGWKGQVAQGMTRRAALLKIFQSMVASERLVLLDKVMEGLKAAVAARGNLLSAVDMASKRRRNRIQAEVFFVWLQYVQAMSADVDPDSPFASPRTGKQDRRMARRFARMMGSVEVDAGSDASSEVFRDIYETERLMAAQAQYAKTQGRMLGAAGDSSSDGGSSIHDQGFGSNIRHAGVAAAAGPQPSSLTNLHVAAPRPGAADVKMRQPTFPTPGGYIAPSPIPFRGVDPTPLAKPSSYPISTGYASQAHQGSNAFATPVVAPVSQRGAAGMSGNPASRGAQAISASTGLIRSTILEKAMARAQATATPQPVVGGTARVPFHGSDGMRQHIGSADQGQPDSPRSYTTSSYASSL